MFEAFFSPVVQIITDGSQSVSHNHTRYHPSDYYRLTFIHITLTHTVLFVLSQPVYKCDDAIFTLSRTHTSYCILVYTIQNHSSQAVTQAPNSNGSSTDCAQSHIIRYQLLCLTPHYNASIFKFSGI